MEIRLRCACWPVARRLFVLLYRTAISLHALVNTNLCVWTFMLGCWVPTGHSAPLQGSSLGQEEADYYVYDENSPRSEMESSFIAGPPPEDGDAAPGYRYSYNSVATQKHMYEGVVICLLAVTAFIGLVVWVLKSNFEERQTRRMRREASLRDRNSNVSPLMTPDSEES